MVLETDKLFDDQIFAKFRRRKKRVKSKERERNSYFFSLSFIE